MPIHMLLCCDDSKFRQILGYVGNGEYQMKFSKKIICGIQITLLMLVVSVASGYAQESNPFNRNRNPFDIERFIKWKFEKLTVMIIPQETEMLISMLNETIAVRDIILENIIVELYNDSIWANSIKVNYEYTLDGDISIQFFELWRDSTWVNSLLLSAEYDSLRRIISFLGEFWMNDSWTYMLMDTFLYDSSSNLTAIFSENWEAEAWLNSFFTKFEYDSTGFLVTDTTYKWSISSWTPLSASIYSYDESAAVHITITEDWNDNLWVNSRKKTAELNALGLDSVITHQQWVTDVWDNSWRTMWRYDDSGNLTLYMVDHWDANEWELTSRTTYTNDENGYRIGYLAESLLGDIWSGFMRGTYNYSGITSVKNDPITPDEFLLLNNYPNPFNPSTVIEFEISTPEYVSLTIFNLRGEEVTRLIDRKLLNGRYKAKWDARGYSSGVYFYQLMVGESTITNKMVLIK